MHTSTFGVAPVEEVDEDDFFTETPLTSKYFNDFSREELKALFRSFSIMPIARGDVIVQQGETGSWAGVLLAGELHIAIDDVRLPGAIGAGQCVGEMAVFADGRRAATISCAVPGRIAAILIKDLHELIDARPAIGAKLVAAFSRSVMETLIAYKVPRWEPATHSPDFRPCDAAATMLDEWMAYLGANEPGFATAPRAAFNCFQVFSFAAGARPLKAGSGVFHALGVVLDGRLECSWPAGARAVDKYGLIGESSLLLDDWSMQLPAIRALSAGSVAVLTEPAFDRLRVEHPPFHAALLYLMAAEAVHQLSSVGQRREPSGAPGQHATAARRMSRLEVDGGRDGSKMEVLYKSKMAVGIKEDAELLAKESAAKLERTAHTLRRYKLLALKYERERDSLAAHIDELQGEMKQVKNLRRELSNAKQDLKAAHEELVEARAQSDGSQNDYLCDRFDQQVADTAAWKETALREHAAREADKQRHKGELADAAQAHARAAELEVRLSALVRAHGEQEQLGKARDDAMRWQAKRIALLEAQAHELREERDRAQLLLKESDKALRASGEERRELAERLRAAGARRRSTLVQQGGHKAAERRPSHVLGALGALVALGDGGGGAVAAGAATPAANAARVAAFDDLTRINAELANALQERSATLWAANRRAAQAERAARCSIDARESATAFPLAHVGAPAPSANARARPYATCTPPREVQAVPSDLTRRPAGGAEVGSAPRVVRAGDLPLTVGRGTVASELRAMPSSIRVAQVQAAAAALALPKVGASRSRSASPAAAWRFGPLHAISA